MGRNNSRYFNYISNYNIIIYESPSRYVKIPNRGFATSVRSLFHLLHECHQNTWSPDNL